jgi:hypothetical protein
MGERGKVGKREARKERGCIRRISRSASLVLKFSKSPACCGWSSTQPRSGAVIPNFVQNYKCQFAAVVV